MTKSRFILHYLLLNKYAYLFAIFCILIVNWLQVEIPRYIQQAIDLFGDQSEASRQELFGYVEWVVGLSVVMVVFRILSRMYALNPGRITEAALKNDLFYKLNRLPNSFHKGFGSGKLISIINNDLNGIRLFYGIGFLQLFNVIFALSLTPIWMWRISPALTLYSIIPILLAFVVFRIGFRKMRALHGERLTRLQDLSEQLMNYLSGIDLIKNQQMDTWVLNEIEQVNQRLLTCTMQITRIQTFIMPVLDYANNLMKVLILGLGGYFLLQQNLTLGEITAFLSYSVLLALPLMHLGRIATVYQMGMVSIDSVLTILNSTIPEQDMALQTPADLTALGQGTLTVSHLAYQYPDGDSAVLHDISFELTPGKKVGILGSIGAGKSTLVNCLNHHLDVAPGMIHWNGRDITTLARQDWRALVRTITQEPYLFSNTIEQNVRFGSTDLAKSEVDQVLQLSQFAEDIARFQDGDQTLVGEKGIMLSGGQKQRLSIARALLSPSDLIIMDNVLSAVDYDTERKILGGLLDRISHQSVLIVSHRISALEEMDEILVLEAGAIVARGDHHSLLRSSAYYKATWDLQQNETEAVT
ncbi:ABC transporter ATP-binding protein [Reinekea forsetii]|jgi:ATP-binding cassette subfamily B protein|uniref:ABC transporter, ATP-binding protein n=1 Tax=Reinekea forsetii TaxID=1336806 RepID=A0A2K8KQJ8_9GAMM|nr:ABC transporter ATP-binding protein [Reinekea forsetii]ATX76997.1 ABC transporter, ATP-binding protein [Reinekea forsetii]